MSLQSRRRGAPATEGVSSTSSNDNKEQGKQEGLVGPFSSILIRTKSILRGELVRTARLRWKEILLAFVVLSYAS